MSPEGGAANDVIVTTTGAYSIDYEAGYEARKERMRRPGAAGGPSQLLKPRAAGVPGAEDASPGIGNSASGYPQASVSRSELIQNIEDKYDLERSRSRSRSKEAIRHSGYQQDSNAYPQPRRYAPQPQMAEQMPVNPNQFGNVQNLFRIDDVDQPRNNTDMKSNSQLSMEPRREVSRGRVPDDSVAGTNANAAD